MKLKFRSLSSAVSQGTQWFLASYCPVSVDYIPSNLLTYHLFQHETSINLARLGGAGVNLKVELYKFTSNWQLFYDKCDSDSPPVW